MIKKNRNVLILLGILLLLLPVMVLVSRTRQSLREDATEGEQANQLLYLTKELVERSNKLSAQDRQSGSIGELESLAQLRKNILLDVMRSDPSKLSDYLLTAEQLAVLPAALTEQGLVEKSISYAGEFTHVIAEDFENDQTETRYYINELELLFPYPPDRHLRTGDSIAVQGVRLDSYLFVPDSIVSVSPEKKVSAQVTRGSKRVLIIQVEVSGSPSLMTKTQVQNVFFAPANSVNAFFKESSFDLLSLSGDVVGPYRVQGTDLETCQDYRDWADKANALLSADGIQRSSYDYTAYMMYGGRNCRALAEVGGDETWILSFQDPLRIISHEMGHVVGMAHANIRYCGVSNSFAPKNTCSNIEYGDLYDIMGNFWYVPGLLQPNGPHKHEVGWFDDAQIQTVQADGTFSLTPTETKTGTKILRVWRGNEKEYMYVSYRQPIGSDATLPAPMTRGASIHTQDFQSPTWLIDSTPNSSPSASFIPFQFTDAPLSDAATVNDTVETISVSQLSHSTSSVSVRVDVPATYNTPPELRTIDVPATISKGSTVSLNVLAYDYSDHANGTVSVYGGDPWQQRDFTFSVVQDYACSGVCRQLRAAIPFPNAGIYYLIVRLSDPVNTVSRYYFVTVVDQGCPRKNFGNITCDAQGTVAIDDLSLLLSKFGTADVTADITGDGLVSIADLAVLLANFGT